MKQKLIDFILTRLTGVHFDIGRDDSDINERRWPATLTSTTSLMALLLFIALGTGMMLHIVGGASAEYELPPRQTPVPGDDADDTPTPLSYEAAEITGGRVHLRAHFSDDWPWDVLHWQEDLWIAVQWHDHQETWYDVAGWHGTLDTIAQEDGWVGTKELWVDHNGLGNGPFRWLVYQGENGRLLATSDPFYLPAEPRGMVKSDLMLAP